MPRPWLKPAAVMMLPSALSPARVDVHDHVGDIPTAAFASVLGVSSAAASLRVLAGAQRRAYAGLVGADAGVVTSGPAWPSAASARTPQSRPDDNSKQAVPQPPAPTLQQLQAANGIAPQPPQEVFGPNVAA
jgi:hypothetical protein